MAVKASKAAAVKASKAEAGGMPSKQEASSASSVLSILRRCACYIFVGFIAFVCLPFVHILGSIVMATGEFGGTLAQADRMKEMYPYHFVPLVNLAAKAQSARNTYTADYFAETRPKVLAGLETFELHPYFEGLEVKDEDVASWHDLIHSRVRLFLRRMHDEQRQDFKLEKDRCDMYNFYSRHEVPILEVHEVWRDIDAVVADVKSGKAFEKVTEWPVFWKACHLTQSSSSGTRAMKARPTKGEELDEFISWLHSKWDYRANDYERKWADAGNEITRGLEPGFLLQAPMVVDKHTWRVDGRISIGLPEVRVEVIWGYAYIGILDGTHVILRNGIVQDFSSVSTFLMPPTPVYDHWVFTEGHADCFFRVAEEAARVAGVDCIRMDVFINRGKPSECIVNENSLSSGIVYWGHEPFMTRMWAEPHRTRAYKLRNTTTPIHLQ